MQTLKGEEGCTRSSPVGRRIQCIYIRMIYVYIYIYINDQVLFQTALIESGYEIADPSALVNRVYKLMSKELGVDPDAPLKEVEAHLGKFRGIVVGWCEEWMYGVQGVRGVE